MQAAHLQRVDVATVLLQSGANVNESLRNGWTALHWAAAHNDEQMLTLLIVSGADPGLKDENGLTALDVVPATSRA